MPRNPQRGVITMAVKPTSKTNSAEKLPTIKQVHQRDKGSEKTVRRAIAQGDLEAMRVGPGKRLLRIHPNAHEAYRKAQRL